MAQYNLYWGTYGSAPALSTLASALSSLPGSVAAMTTINEAGGVKCWLLPDTDTNLAYRAGCAVMARSVCVHYAVGDWSDVPEDAETVNLTVSGSFYQAYVDNRTSGAVELKVYGAFLDVTPFVTLVADELKGVANFNLSVPALGLMNDEPSAVFHNASSLAIDEGYLYAHLFLKDFSNVNINTPKEYMFYRATSVTENYLNTNGDAVLLSATGNIEIAGTYGNHYVSVLLPNIHASQYQVTLQHSLITLMGGKVYQLYVGSADDAASINTLLESIYFTEQRVTYTRGTMCNDVFVRWFNTQGGVDTFRFARRQIMKESAKTSQSAQRTYRNGEPLIVAEEQPIALSVTRVLALGAENVSAKNVELLSTLALSQYIQFFSSTIDMYKWIRCKVDKYDIKRETDASALNYEIELAIPTLNTLF